MSIGLFVDFNSTYRGVMGKFRFQRPSYQGFLDKAKEFGNVVHANAYGIQAGNQQHFVTALEAIGYRIITKRVQVAKKRDYHYCVQMTLDVMESLNVCDAIVIVSVDHNLSPLLREIVAEDAQLVLIGADIPIEMKMAALEPLGNGATVRPLFVEITNDLLYNDPRASQTIYRPLSETVREAVS